MNAPDGTENAPLYVIGDIHGRLDLLDRLIEAIYRDAGSGTIMSASPIMSAGDGTFNLSMWTANAQSIPLPGGWSDLSNYTIAPAERFSALNVGTVGTSSGTAAVTITSAAWIAFLVELRSQ
jgi:hypothetical protein